MNEPRPHDYAEVEIGPIYLPDPALVDGWWQRTYRFTLPDGADTSNFEVPVPQEGFDGAIVVVRLLESASEITVQTFARQGPAIAAEMTIYLSLIAMYIKEEFGEEVTHGDRGDHPLFTIARRSEK